MDVARPEPVKAEPAHDLATIIPADIEFAESALEAASGQFTQPRPTPGMARKSSSGSRAPRGRKIQAKLAVGASNDPLEVEADLVAQRVVDALHGQDSDPIQRPAREAGGLDVVERRLEDMRQAGHLADASALPPGWRRDVALNHGLPFNPKRTLQVSIHLTIDGHDGQLMCTAGRGWF